MQLKPQKFTIEQFQDQASWIGNLFGPLNQLFNDLWISYNNNLSIKDNLFQEIKELSFKNETNSFPLIFRTKFNQFPQGMIQIYLYDKTLSSFAAINPAIDWTFRNNEIVISSLSGLTSSHSYTIRFLVIYG